VKSSSGFTCDQSVIVLGPLALGVVVAVAVPVGVPLAVAVAVVVPVGVPLAVAVAVVVAVVVAVGVAPSSRKSTSGLPHHASLERAWRAGVEVAVGLPPPKLSPEQAIIVILMKSRSSDRAKAGPVFLQRTTKSVLEDICIRNAP
jgi:hypothetical protein